MITIEKWKVCLIGVLSELEFWMNENIYFNKPAFRFFHTITGLDYRLRDSDNRKPVWMFTCSCGKEFLAQGRGKLTRRVYPIKKDWVSSEASWKSSK